jgi:hypothetical protein
MTADDSDTLELFARPRYFAVIIIAIVAFVALFVAFFWPRPVPLTDARVRNASQFTLTDVVIGKGHYGDITAGEITEYRTWGPAYPHPLIAFHVGTQVLRLVPEDHVSEQVLGPGRFTYVLTVGEPISESKVSIIVSKD